MIKAAFFDIDGTLVSFRTHTIPESTLQALDALRQRGIRVFIATGRPVYLIDNLGSLEHDGMITLNGNYCIDSHGAVIAHSPIPGEDVEAVLQRLRSGDRFPCAFMTADRVYINYVNHRVEEIARMVQVAVPHVADLEKIAQRDAIYQINVYVEPNKEAELMRTVFTHCDSSRWNPDFSDINVRGIDKAAGIDRMIARHGITPEECISFGDGGNDIPMLRHAGIGIAMGNSSDDVKEAADYVTTSVDDSGIYHACRHFGLL